jgi:hypothetical protein
VREREREGRQGGGEEAREEGRDSTGERRESPIAGEGGGAGRKSRNFSFSEKKRMKETCENLYPAE